ncbi:MAG: hypothetical protein ACO1TE_29290, partial [Prosthecobacter sp.]
MSTQTKTKAVRPIKLRKPAAIYRLIQRKAKGQLKSPYWHVRVRLARGSYQQRSSNTTHKQAAKEFALLWIKEDFPQLCAALDIKPLIKPRLEAAPPPPR